MLTQIRIETLKRYGIEASLARRGVAPAQYEVAIRAHLTMHGVTAGPLETRYGAEGEGPSIYLQDPEGNTIELKGPPQP